MVVRIEEIRPGGLALTQPVGTKLLEEALEGSGPDTGFRALGPAEGRVVLTRVGDGVLVKGHYDLQVAAPCRRCVTDVKLDVPVDFLINLVPRPQRAKADEDDDDEASGKPPRDEGDRAGTFSIEDTDQEVFDGKTIDLDPILREQVLLALPMHAVCREDCKGLCPSCGQDLNQQQCACETKAVDPRLAPLKNIKLN